MELLRPENFGAGLDLSDDLTHVQEVLAAATSSPMVRSRRRSPPKVMPRARSLVVSIWWRGCDGLPRMVAGLLAKVRAMVATS